MEHTETTTQCICPVPDKPSAPPPDPSTSIVSSTRPKHVTAPTVDDVNVKLNVPIRGLENVRSRVLRSLIKQAAIEILGNEPDNRDVTLDVIVFDGAASLYVKGLLQIVTKQLEYARWSISDEQRECIRSVEFDAGFKTLVVRLTDAVSETTATQIERDDRSTEAGEQKNPDDDHPNTRDGEEPGHGTTTIVRRGTTAHRTTATRPHAEARSPFFAVQVSPKEGCDDIPSSEPLAAPAPRRTDILDRHKTRIIPVTRFVGNLAASVAITRNPITLRIEMYASKSKKDQYYSIISVGGIVVFDWRLLNATAWPIGELNLQLSMTMPLLINFNVLAEELTICLYPANVIDSIYRQLHSVHDICEYLAANERSEIAIHPGSKRGHDPNEADTDECRRNALSYRVKRPRIESGR
jgi:hypothetical protein